MAGGGGIERVEVEPSEDSWGRAVYLFSFLVDYDRMTVGPGLFRIRLLQQLGDELLAAGDEHLPAVRILKQEDWARRYRAVFN